MRTPIMMVAVILFVAISFAIPVPVYAEESECPGSCVSSSSGAREMGIPPCYFYNEWGQYIACPLKCCKCWLVTAAGLDEESKDALRKWEREVWQTTPGLKYLSDTYRMQGSWGWHLASLVYKFGAEDQALLFLEWLAQAVE